MTPPYEKTPLWMTIVIIVCMLPVLAFPFGISAMPTDTLPKYLVWFYPAYVLVAGYCAWLIYPQKPVLAWILVVMLLLTHAAMYLLV